MNEISATEISRTNEYEVGTNQYMAEIKFDCLVTMFDALLLKNSGGFFSGRVDKPLPPQWFKSKNKITLEGIKYTDPYALGMLLKDMLRQLEDHIENYKREM